MKALFENWRRFINEGVMDDKPYRTDAQAKRELEGSIYTEEDSEDSIEKVVKDVLKDEGGAAGLDPIEKAVDDLELPEGFDLKDFLKGLRGVGQHEDGDYILEDGEEVHVKEGIEIFLEAQKEVLDEKEGKKDACYHKVKARYKVWPSAYGSGALVQCRAVGAKNWGTGGK